MDPLLLPADCADMTEFLTDSCLTHIHVSLVPDSPINESGLIQMIRMGQSICHKWVNVAGHLGATKACQLGTFVVSIQSNDFY